MIFGQVRARDQVDTVVILGMLQQDIHLFLTEYVSLILVLWQSLKTYILAVFSSPKAHPTYKNVVGILG